MFYIHKKQRIILILLILIESCLSQITINPFRPSNLELKPHRIVVNSSGIADFLCINHRTENIPFGIHLSKNISKKHLKLSRYQINETTLHIRMHFKNYLGIFRLFCYLQNQKDSGIRSDIIVIKDSDSIQLIERCRVYDHMFIKCIFFAPIIAHAISSGFPFEFQFIESSSSPAYSSHYLFLENESRDDSLVFQWYPTHHEHFPANVQMNMSVRIPHFNPIFYRFNLTPIFVIKPNFTLEKVLINQIQIRFNSVPPNAICQKRISSKKRSSKWTKIYSSRNNTIITRLRSNTIYQICLRCRENFNDPPGEEECRQIRTSQKFHEMILHYLTSYFQVAILIVPGLCLIFVALISCIFFLRRRKQSSSTQYSSASDDPVDDEDPVVEDNRSGYEDIFGRTTV